jgi:peptide deformylase
MKRYLFTLGMICMGVLTNEIYTAETATLMEKRIPRVLDIAKLGHPILSSKAKRVENPRDPEIRLIVDDMKATLDKIGSYAGLAAPQVFIPLRIVFFNVPKEKGEEVPLTLMINPEWIPLSDEKELGWEGCFSLPGLMGEVPRYKKISYSYQNLEGETIHKTAEGFHARVVQHECDHLDGICYIQRMNDLTRLGFVEEARYLKTPKKD